MRCAAVMTVWHPHSHADVIIRRWLESRESDARWGWRGPQSEIVSFFVAERPPHDGRIEPWPERAWGEVDLAALFAQKYGIPLYPSVEEALTRGGETLAVDAVLLIGEHGRYPTNPLGQQLYPRRERFEEIADVFRDAGRAVNVFCDKHYSYSLRSAHAMAETARRLGFLLFGGSSVPLALPGSLDLPAGTPMEEAVCVYQGPEEAYGYHSCEAAQSVLERRAGGECGVRQVTGYRGAAVWQLFDSGGASRELLEAAAAAGELPETGDDRRTAAPEVSAFVIEHCDGLKTTHVNLSGQVRDWSLAVRVGGQRAPAVGRFALEDASTYFGHFAGLARVIERGLRTGDPGYPPRRNLMTTVQIGAACRALAQPGVPYTHRLLDVRYAP